MNKGTGKKPKPFVSGLLLAAGSSSRLGRTKQLERLDGVALVSRAAAALARAGVDEVVAVVGHRAADVVDALGEKTAKVVMNREYKNGLSSSLRKGVEALDVRSEAVVVCLADQPFVNSELIDRIIDRFVETGAEAVAAGSGDLVSPPVLLSRKLYGKISKLTGDKGAKSVALAEPTFQKVEVNEDTLLDVDTEEALIKAKRLLAGTASTATGRAADTPARRRPSSGK